MAEEADAPLRDIALTGRFLGGAPAERVSAFVASGDAAHHLTAWFGQEWLAALARQPNRVCLLRAALDRDIAIIDEIVSSQLDAVTQHPRYTRLEGSWRGIDWLVDRTPQAGRIRLRILHARWAEVCRDLERALEFDQSVLFRKIYEEEFGTPGGKPFGLIAADYQIRHRSTQDYPTDDVGALARFAGIAAAAFAPTIFAAAPELLGLDSFADVSASLDLSVVLRGGEYQRWRNIGNQDDLRFIGVALPRLLARPPWPDDGTRADRFRYRTHVPRAEQRVWMSPVYGFAAVALRAFERNSWPGDVRGADINDEARGGVLDGLPVERFASDVPDEAPPRAPLELALTDDQETQVSQASLIPLSALEGLPEACFGMLPSLHRPPRMTGSGADANQKLSAQLNTLLCVSRFAHMIKLIGREMLGNAVDPADVELRLQRWLNGFISGVGSGGAEVAAKYPLQEAKVDVREQIGRPGSYGCVIHLKPHHQLDEVGASFRFVTDFLPRKAAA